jgi:hypothetical protein
MPENTASSLLEAERAELEAVAEALAKSPRLLRLVRYLGEKYFLGEIDQLHEYNIATEVFGRSKTVFDAGEDAIARVEAHRLRKRLKQFYEAEGRDHTVRLSIPSGTYVPVFTHLLAEESSPDSVAPAAAPEEPARSISASPSAPGEGAPEQAATGILTLLKRPRWMILLAGGLALAAFVVYIALQHGGNSKDLIPQAGPGQPPAPTQSASSNSASLPIRLIAGYTGNPQMDSAGARWEADHFFHGGGSWRRPATFIARTSDPLIFEQWRTGDFFYDIPLPPGVYELHLYFVTSERSNENTSTFTVGINGNSVLQGFDVNSDAFGENIADERVFRDVSPSKDGYLHLSFTGERGVPALSALEILPGIPHQQIPVRLVTQPTPFTDHDGQFWHPDTYFMNGRMSSQRQQIAGSPDPDLFAAERYGHFSYAIPVDTRGRYTLILHFAEFYFGPHASGVGGTGSRVFRVMCNGTTLLDDFDIFKEAGSLHSLTKTFYHLKPTAQGKLYLTFEPIANNATISGIEVLDESQ